nr:efflux transporter outer membrane subunit [Parvularcula dongshanensis]
MAASLSACVVGPDTTPPELETPRAFATPAPFDGEERDWWLGFGDETLDGLIQDALRDNLDVRIAQARLAEAAALVRAERSDLLPTIDGFADGTISTDLEGDGGTQESAAGGLAMSFVPDLFGGRRRELEAARALLAATEFDRADLRRLTASSVASTYLELRRIDARLALLETSLDLQNRTLEIVRLRAEAGLAADLDVQRALADLAQTRAQRGPLVTARADADNALAVLTGRQPTGELVVPLEGGPVPIYADGPDAGVPAELLRRRPDLRAAEADLVRATALVGAEVSDLYPSLSLPGRITADIETPGALARQTVASLSAVIDVPLFDFGRRRAEVRAAEARAQATLLTYERTLLSALREVETALVSIRSAEDRRADLAIAVDASEQAFSQLQALYTEGLASLIEVLDAQRQLISSREAFVNSEAELALSAVALYRALGVSSGPVAEVRY